ncbi:MAG: hypothetical protein P9L92_01255 [Candidatus Electryonea clarkiae]|nr:hypothetical protein [Candidatus Electryonea clarkiae]MDP8287577.1 hypothetical protein [Candidatus Electryonea clarkiae]
MTQINCLTLDNDKTTLGVRVGFLSFLGWRVLISGLSELNFCGDGDRIATIA